MGRNASHHSPIPRVALLLRLPLRTAIRAGWCRGSAVGGVRVGVGKVVSFGVGEIVSFSVGYVDRVQDVFLECVIFVGGGVIAVLDLVVVSRGLGIGWNRVRGAAASALLVVFVASSSIFFALIASICFLKPPSSSLSSSSSSLVNVERFVSAV